MSYDFIDAVDNNLTCCHCKSRFYSECLDLLNSQGVYQGGVQLMSIKDTFLCSRFKFNENYNAGTIPDKTPIQEVEEQLERMGL